VRDIGPSHQGYYYGLIGNPYFHFRLVPKSATLDDLERCIQPPGTDPSFYLPTIIPGTGKVKLHTSVHSQRTSKEKAIKNFREK